MVRGLCDACYRRHKAHGTLDREYPKVRRSSILLEEYDHLSKWGIPVEEIAARLGVKAETLKTEIGRRARKSRQDAQ